MSVGILTSSTNTGVDSELKCIFTAPISVLSNQPAYVQDMLNLKRRASSQNVQRWEIETGIFPENNSANFLLHSVVNGHSTPFYVRMPQVYGMTRSAANTAVNNGAGYIAGVNSVVVDTALVAGEFIKFHGHSKVYLVITGGTTAVIFPPLIAAIADNEVVYTDTRVTLLAMYDTSVQLGITYKDGVLSDPGSVKLVESL